MPRIEPEAAPLWRRTCAELVDALLWIAVQLPVVYVVLGDRDAPHGLRRLRPLDDERTTRWMWRIAIAQRVIHAGTHNARGPGERLLGVRWADAATGGPVPLRRGVVHELLRGGLEQLGRAVGRRRMDRFKAHSASVARQTEQLRVTLAGEPEALQREIAALQRTNGISCWGGLWPGCAIALINAGSRLRSPLRQSLIERIAGVVVIRDHG